MTEMGVHVDDRRWIRQYSLWSSLKRAESPAQWPRGCTIECVESIRYFSVGDAASFDGSRSRIIHRTNETNQANYTVSWLLKTRISLQVFARDASKPTSLRPWNERRLTERQHVCLIIPSHFCSTKELEVKFVCRTETARRSGNKY